MMDYRALNASRQRSRSRDLGTSTPRPQDLENDRPRPRILRPNFFLKAALLTFDDFKERFGRVHAELLEKSRDRFDGFAPRGSCSACETNSQKGDHTSTRSKSSTSIFTRSTSSFKPMTLPYYKHSNQKCLKDGDKLTSKSREIPSKEGQDLLIARKTYLNCCNMPGLDASTGHETYSNSQSESAFKTVDVYQNGRYSKYSKGTTCKLGGHIAQYNDCRVAIGGTATTRRCLRKTESVGSGISMNRNSNLSSFTRKCLEATRGRDVCENECEVIRKASAVIDELSGKLKRSDSEQVYRRRKRCRRISSEASVNRSCTTAESSEIEDLHYDKQSSETCSVVSECESCLQTRLVQRSHTEGIIDNTNGVLESTEEDYGFSYEVFCRTNRVLASKEDDYGISYEDICDANRFLASKDKDNGFGYDDICDANRVLASKYKDYGFNYEAICDANRVLALKDKDNGFNYEDICDTNRFLALKAKDYGFNYEDICDVTEPVIESSNSDNDDIDDLNHLNAGRYSNDEINKTKMMIIRRSYQKPSSGGGEGFTLRGGFSIILRPLKGIVRYFPLPPVSITFENKSPIDKLFRNEDLYKRFQNKNTPDEDHTTTDGSIGQASVTASITPDKEGSYNSVWMGDSVFSLSSETSTMTPDENLSEEYEEEESESSFFITQLENDESLYVSPSERSCIEQIGQLDNSAFNGQITKRNKSEPSFGCFPNQKHALKKSFADLRSVPSRIIPMQDCEGFEPKFQLLAKKIFRILGLTLIVYSGWVLGYVTLIIYFIDMFFGPDFTSLIYLVIGIIITYVYRNCKTFRSKRNDKKMNRPTFLKQIHNN